MADTIDVSRKRRRSLGPWQAGAIPAAGARAANRPVRFVVVETREFARSPHLAPDAANHTVLLPRGPAEPLEAFSLRATQRVLALERDQQMIRLMLMLLAPRFDARLSTARLLLVRALMTQAAAQPDQAPKLVLCADEHGDPSVQRGLMAFVDLMLSEPNSWSLPIQVKFGSPRRWTSLQDL